MDFPTFKQLFEIARNEALIRSAPLSQSAIDREGSDANILVAAATAAADEAIGQLVVATAGLFLDSAQGDALDRLLFDRYGLVRKLANNAIGAVTFSTAVTNPAPFSIASGTQLKATTGLIYETVGNYTFSSGVSTLANVQVRSLLAGANQQAKANTLINIVSTIPGAPVSLSVTNPLATAGATDAETDAEFRERGRAFFTTVQRGTLSSIEQGALAVPGVVRANAFEMLDTNGRPARQVSLVIADSFTDALADYSVVPPAYQSQANTLSQTVFNALEDYRPAGVFVEVQLAETILEPVTLSLALQAGVDSETVSTSARAVVVNFINNLDPGTGYTRRELVQALQGISGLIITEADLLNPGNVIVFPAGDRVPTPLQILRTSLPIVRASA